MIKKSIIYLVMLFCYNVTFAQSFNDSLHVQVGVTATVASEDYQPLWLTSNKWGTVADRQSDLSPHIHLFNVHELRKKQSSGTDATAKPTGFYVKYGLDAYLNNRFKDAFFEQLYLKVGYKSLEFRAGRYEELIGVTDPILSSGSMGISGNSLPIPKIGLAVTKFTDVRFTGGFLKFKGTFAHGFLGNNNYLKSAYLHEKSLYLSFGKSKLRFIVGGQHYAEWGGKRPGINLNRSFKDFLDIVFVKWQNDGSTAPGTALSFAGDHRITIDGALQWMGEKATFNLYQQSPFESGDGFSFKSHDALRGLAVTFNKSSGLTKIVAEVLSTKQMFDFVPIGYRETYYNNWAYKTGWEYNDRIIGTPLFINRQRGSKYFPEIKPYNWDAPADSIPVNSNIINNRVVAFHLGLTGRFIGNTSTKLLLTYTKNYGTYYDGPFKNNPKTQLYTMLEMLFPLVKNKLELKTDLGGDFGDLTNNVGLLVGAVWNVK